MQERISVSGTLERSPLLLKDDALLVRMGPVSSPSHGSKRLKLLARRLAPNLSPTPPLVAVTSSDAAPPASNTSSNSNSTLAPSGLVQPPVSPHTGKLELFIWIVLNILFAN
jgi:hypothetical protein